MKDPLNIQPINSTLSPTKMVHSIIKWMDMSAHQGFSVNIEQVKQWSDCLKIACERSELEFQTELKTQVEKSRIETIGYDRLTAEDAANIASDAKKIVEALVIAMCALNPAHKDTYFRALETINFALTTLNAGVCRPLKTQQN